MSDITETIILCPTNDIMRHWMRPENPFIKEVLHMEGGVVTTGIMWDGTRFQASIAGRGEAVRRLAGRHPRNVILVGHTIHWSNEDRELVRRKEESWEAQHGWDEV